MAYATTSASGSVRDGAQGLFARLRATLQRRAVYNRTLRELNALTSRELSDLGINRSMITRLALEAAYGKAVK